jgi:hypothetical protein
VVAPRNGYNPEVRHLAVDATAAVVASNGTRDHSVSPDVEVTTLAERDRAVPVITVEHGVAFAIHHDGMNPDGSYSAVIRILKGPIKRVQPSGDSPDPERKQPRPSFAPVLAA